MPAISMVRTWVDDARLAVQRADESVDALTTLRHDASALKETLDWVGNGSSFDDPFDALLGLAEQGNRGLRDGWTSAGATESLLRRAAAQHPGGAGAASLIDAHRAATAAHGAIEGFIVSGGTRSFDAVARLATEQLGEARRITSLLVPVR